MNLQENIPVHIKRRIYSIDKVIDNLLPNMYPCDYNSSDHFVEGVLDEVFYFFGEDPNFYGIDLISINDFILDHKYDELTDYFNDHCIVLKNDNLQESIRRILREEKDYTKLIKGIIDSSDIFDYKHFCGVDVISPEERIDQQNFLHKDKIPYLIKVYFVGGVNSEVWPITQAIHRKQSDVMEELLEYIKSFVPFNIEMWRAYVNTCDGYDKLMKRKYTTDDLQESIRKVLREETELDKQQLKKIKIVKNFINTLYPNFNKEGVKIEKRIMDPLAYQKRFEDIRYEYRDLETNKYYATYHEKNNELQLNRKIFESLEDFLGDEIMEYIIDWFNDEFNKNAESVTF